MTSNTLYIPWHSVSAIECVALEPAGFTKRNRRTSRKSWWDIWPKKDATEEAYYRPYIYGEDEWYSTSEIHDDERFVIINNRVYTRDHLKIRFKRGGWHENYLEYFDSEKQVKKRIDEILYRFQNHGIFIIKKTS